MNGKKFKIVTTKVKYSVTFYAEDGTPKTENDEITLEGKLTNDTKIRKEIIALYDVTVLVHIIEKEIIEESRIISYDTLIKYSVPVDVKEETKNND